MTETKSSLHVAGKTIDLPIKKPTMGSESSICAHSSRKRVYSVSIPGFISTASCESNITDIDGDAGVLLYRRLPN